MPHHKRCCVDNCPNVKSYYHSQKSLLNPQQKRPTNTYRIFKFPVKTYPQRARKWAEAIGKPEMEINSSTFICSDHFEKGDFGFGTRCLASWAIPKLKLSISDPALVISTQNEEHKSDLESQKRKGSNAVLGQGQPCLICSSDDTRQMGEFRSSLRFTGDHDDSSSKLLDDQLWSTFILRNVLKLSRGDYQNLLERVGGSVQPSKWFVVCQTCERTSLQILNVHESLRKLEKELERLLDSLKNKLQESLQKEDLNQRELDDSKQDDMTILNVRQEIRTFLRMITPTPCVPKEEPLDLEEGNMISDFDQAWLSSPQPELAPVKHENSVPSPSPTTVPESQLKDKDKKIPMRQRPSVKRRQPQRKKLLKTVKAKQLNAQEASPNPTPPTHKKRIRKYRKRKITPAMCELCGHSFTSECDLEKHMIKHKIYDHSIDPTISTTHLICNLCPALPPALFPTRKLLSAHKREQHAKELNLHIFKCSECPETFFWKLFFNDHVLRKHPLKFFEQPDADKQKIFKCDKCDYQSVLGCHLRRHNLSHQTEPLICQYCSSSLKNDLTLKKHMKAHHPQELQAQGKTPEDTGVVLVQSSPRQSRGDKRFPCKNCDAIFSKKLELKLHLESTHKDLFTYQCDLCDKSYLSFPSLQTHKKIKHLEKGKKSKCGWCGKVVTHKTYLWSHMKFCPKKPTEGMGPAINPVDVD